MNEPAALSYEESLDKFLKETNLCDSCKFGFADCLGRGIVFGLGKWNDNVVFCEEHTKKQAPPENDYILVCSECRHSEDCLVTYGQGMDAARRACQMHLFAKEPALFKTAVFAVLDALSAARKPAEGKEPENG